MKLRTLIRRESGTNAPDTEAGPGGLRDAARRVAEGVRQNPRVQEAAADLRARASELRGTVRDQADHRLERLIEGHHARRGETMPQDVSALLAGRRREREERAGRLRARATLLALAGDPEQRRVLGLVAQATLWAGGEGEGVRYTALLDRLAPSGEAEAEMRVHRALWTLAERRVLAVSPHGAVTACPLAPPSEEVVEGDPAG